MKLFAFVPFVTSAALAADPYCPTDAEQYPAIKTADDARAAVEPTYIKHLPMTDAWGHPYRVDSNATSFRVVSAGADGIFKPETWTIAGQLPRRWESK